MSWSKVVKAPEPDNIIWENLEFSKVKRSIRQNVTGLVSFFLLIVSFALILGASGVQDTYSQIVPKIAYCQSEVRWWEGSHSSEFNRKDVAFTLVPRMVVSNPSSGLPRTPGVKR